MVKIEFTNLPEAPNCHELAKLLEEEISDAVGMALCAAYEDHGPEYTVHVPSF